MGGDSGGYNGGKRRFDSLPLNHRNEPILTYKVNVCQGTIVLDLKCLYITKGQPLHKSGPSQDGPRRAFNPVLPGTETCRLGGHKDHNAPANFGFLRSRSVL